MYIISVFGLFHYVTCNSNYIACESKFEFSAMVFAH